MSLTWDFEESDFTKTLSPGYRLGSLTGGAFLDWCFAADLFSAILLSYWMFDITWSDKVRLSPVVWSLLVYSSFEDLPRCQMMLFKWLVATARVDSVIAPPQAAVS